MLVSGPGLTEEIEETLQAAHRDYWKGNLQAALSGYQYVLLREPDHREASRHAALTLRNLQDPEAALPLWYKASLLDPQDILLLNQLGWSYLAVEDRKKSQETFERALQLTSPHQPEYWEAHLGLGLTFWLDRQPQEAEQELHLITQNHPSFPTAAHLLGKVLTERKKLFPASAFFQKAFAQDPFLGESLRSLAQTYEKIGQTDAAWKALEQALQLDPQDRKLREKLRRLGKYTRKKPQDLSSVRRTAWPHTYWNRRSFSAPPSSWKAPQDWLWVALYSSHQGEPHLLTSWDFLCSDNFKVYDPQFGNVVIGRANDTWSFRFHPATGVLDLISRKGTADFSTRQHLKIVVEDPQASCLIKNAAPAEDPSVDFGDRELRGHFILTPKKEGVQLLNALPMELYLYSVLSRQAEQDSPPEYLKALAVILRTQALKRRDRKPHFDFHLCDSSHCLPYPGVHVERTSTYQALLDTQDQILIHQNKIFIPSYHPNCGGILAPRQKGAPRSDSASPQRLPQTPWELEAWVRRSPSALYCNVPNPSFRWTRWVEDRSFFEEIHSSSRTVTGRLVSPPSALSAPGPRSRLFTWVLLYKGKKPFAALLWGAGTGNGKGLCQAGAQALASQHKKSYREILRHYFPEAQIHKL